MIKPSIDIELLDRKLNSFISYGRESAVERISKIERMKKEILGYAEIPSEELPKTMMKLSKQTIPFKAAELISSITVGSLLQGFGTIEGKKNRVQVDAINDFDSIRMAIASLCYFLILVSRFFEEEDFALLFAESLDYYDKHAEKIMAGLAMLGSEWKERYGGILPFSVLFQATT